MAASKDRPACVFRVVPTTSGEPYVNNAASQTNMVVDTRPLTANAIAAILHFDMRRQKLSDVFNPSRLFVYYNERDREGTIGLDVEHGRPVYMIDCIKTICRKGVCPRY